MDVDAADAEADAEAEAGNRPATTADEPVWYLDPAAAVEAAREELGTRMAAAAQLLVLPGVLPPTLQLYLARCVLVDLVPASPCTLVVGGKALLTWLHACRASRASSSSPGTGTGTVTDSALQLHLHGVQVKPPFPFPSPTLLSAVGEPAGGVACGSFGLSRGSVLNHLTRKRPLWLRVYVCV